MFSLICARINSLVNTREAGDLRRHRSHYDVIVMNENEWGGGGGLFITRKLPPFTMWVGLLTFLCATNSGVWTIPSFRIWVVLHDEHISCVITNCGQQLCILFSQLFFRLCWWKTLLENAVPIFGVIVQIVGFLVFCTMIQFLIFLWLSCYCSMWLYFNPGN